MRRMISIVISGLMVVSMCAVFSSCGSTSCSLDSISLSLDSYPTFILDDEAMSTMSEQQLEEKNATISSLNRAIQDRPELASMLSADMIDGGSNDYVYEGGESFLKVVGEFADENYSKAQRMFPKITCDEFYYHTSYAYSACNHNPELFETPYIDSMNTENHRINYFIPTFDQLMSSAFWTSYCSVRFGIEYDDEIPFDERFECDSLDSNIIFELSMMLQMGTLKSVISGDIPIGEIIKTYPVKNKVLSNYMTTYIRKKLREYGMKNVRTDSDDFFTQLGTESFYMSSVIEDYFDVSNFIKLGHRGFSSSAYLSEFTEIRPSPGLGYASLICAGIGGEKDWAFEDIMATRWDVIAWYYSNEMRITAPINNNQYERNGTPLVLTNNGFVNIPDTNYIDHKEWEHANKEYFEENCP